MGAHLSESGWAVTLDPHTPCAVCAVPVQELFATAARLMHLLEQEDLFTHHGEGIVIRMVMSRDLAAAILHLHFAVQALAPLVEAHFANQDHALSPELAGARDPKVAGALVLERDLPFPGDSDR